MKLTKFFFKAAFFIVGISFIAGGAVLLKQGDAAVTAVMFLLFGLALIALLMMQLRRERQKRAKQEELRLIGRRMTGVVVKVRDSSTRVNGRPGQIATVQVKTPSGAEVELDSDRLWDSCPEEGDSADVLFDMMDESQYLIEFSGKK